jgi:glycine oxidase
MSRESLIMSDVLIIGGGIIGLLTAHELADAGLSITLVDKGETGRESSWAGGGILSPLYPWRYPNAVNKLAQWSQDYYPTLAKEISDQTGIDPEWTQSGLLILDTAEKSEALQWANKFATLIQEIDAAEIKACEPKLGQPPESALWMPQVAQIRNPRLSQAVKRNLAGQGVNFKEHTEVLDFIISENCVKGVQTNAGKLFADKVVVAAGAWSGRLLKGIKPGLEVNPVRGQMLLIAARPNLVTRIVLNHKHYLIPRRDGRVLVGSTVEHVGFDKSTTEAAHKILWHSATELIPDLAKFPIENHWAGLRPSSPFGIPFIGEHPKIEGLYVNTGHFRNGVVLGPASARLLADIILERNPIVAPDAYKFPESQDIH